MEGNILKSVCWDITSRCNDNCSFCYRNSANKELQYEQNQYILKSLIDLGIDKVSFVGGEPLLYDGLFSLVRWGKEYCNEKTLFSITTNTILLTCVKRNKVEIDMTKMQTMLDLFDWISFSLDASYPALQEKIGRNKFHFERIENILNYVSNEKTSKKIKINTVVCKENLDNLEELYHFLERYDVKRWKLFRFLPSRGSAEKNKERYYVTQDEFARAINRIEKLNMGKMKISFNDYDRFDNSYVNISSEGKLVVYDNSSYEEKMDLKTEKIEKIYDFIDIEKHCASRADFIKV